MRTGRSHAAPALFALFLLLIGVAWALADPPGAGPDEPAHYIKALGVAGGDLDGRSPQGASDAEVRALLNTRHSPEELARLRDFLGQKPPARRYTHGRRVSVGADGSWLFAPDAGWVPPLGWWTWIAVVLAATGAYLLAGWRASTALAGSP